MRDFFRYVSVEFGRGEPIAITLLWLFALWRSRGIREAEIARWRSAGASRRAFCT